MMAFLSVAAQSTENRNLSGFTKVSFGVSGNLNIRIGNEFKVVLEGDKDLLAAIETNVSNDRLTIRIKERENRRRGRRDWNWYQSSESYRFRNEKVTINITMPAISELSVSGSGTAEVFDSFKTGSLSLSVSGSGKLILNDVLSEDLSCSVSGSGGIIINSVSGKELDCRISGSGSIRIRGNGFFNNADIGITGSGDYFGEFLKLDTAVIAVTGSGDCICNVVNSLEARVTGSGDITYHGNPPRINVRSTGSGKIRSR